MNIKRSILSIYNRLSVIPQHVQADNYWFYNISSLAYVLIMLLHAVWALVFFIMKLDTMVYLQFASISVFVAAITLNRKGYHLAGMIICLFEINVHQFIAVSLLGWMTGFQNFIPLIALMPFLKYNEKWYTKSLLTISCLLFYLYIDFFIKNDSNARHISESSLNFLNISNAFISFVLVSLWGIVLAYSYQKSVNALIIKEQELNAAQKATEQAEILRKLDIKERDNEIFQLRNVELKQSNDEILTQKQLIEQLVADQELTILKRTGELAEANAKLTEVNKRLLELIQFNAHNIREPLTRIMGAMLVFDFMTQEEFNTEIWPHMSKATKDLDNAIKEVIVLADGTITTIK